MWPHHLLFAIFFAIVSTLSAAAFQQGRSGGHDVPSISSAAISDLMEDSNHLTQPLAGRMPSVDKALQTLKSLESMPACNRVATAALIHSCASIEAPSSPDWDGINLEATKSIYATRLAVCELAEAGVAIPPKCTAFVPTARQASKAGFGGFFKPSGPTEPVAHYPQYDDITEQYLHLCLGALQDKSQWWTSYSNARQNSVQICHGMRFGVERDMQVEIHRKLTEVVIDVTEASRMSAHESQATMNTLKELRLNIHQFQMQFYEGQLEKQAEIARYWQSCSERLQADLNSILGRTGSILSDLSLAAIGIHKNTDHTDEAFKHVRQQIVDSLQLLRTGTDSLSEHNEMVVAKLETTLSSLLDGIFRGLYNMEQKVELSIALTTTHREALQQHGLALVDVRGSFSQLSMDIIDTRTAAQELQNSFLEAAFKLGIVQNETQKAAEKLRTTVEEVDLAFGGLMNLIQTISDYVLACSWKAARLSVHFLLFVNLAFAFCYRFCGFSLMSSIAWGTIFGLLAALIRFFTGPIELLEHWHQAGSSETAEWIFVGLCAITIAALLLHAAFNQYRRVWSSALPEKEVEWSNDTFFGSTAKVSTDCFLYYNPLTFEYSCAPLLSPRHQDDEGFARRWQV